MLYERLTQQTIGNTSLAAYQHTQVHAIRDYAATHSPFYRERGDAFTTARDIREEGQRMLCVGQGEIARIVTLASSGTTGLPKRLYFTEEEQARTLSYFAASMAQITGPGERSALLLPCQSTGGVGDLLTRALQSLGAEPLQMGPVSHMDRSLALLRSYEASSLVGVPSQVLSLARYAELYERQLPQLNAVLLCSDSSCQSMKEIIQHCFQCEVFDYYGMTELGYLGGMDCPSHTGIHLQEAEFSLEIINPLTGELLPEGEYGEVVITTLQRKAMPLIRYRTGDISRILPGSCPCGSPLRRLDRVRTRQEGQVFFPDGSILCLSDLDQVLFPLPGLCDFSARARWDGKVLHLYLDLLLLPLGLDLHRVEEALEGLKLSSIVPHIQVRYSDGVIAPRTGKRILDCERSN